MAFLYRRNINGNDTVIPAKPYKLDATYAATAKRGDLVRLNGSGELVKVGDNDTSALGVLETIEIKMDSETDRYGAVRSGAGAIYEVPVVGGTPVVGTAYGIDANQNLNVADTTTTIAKVVAVRSATRADVVISARQLV